MTPNEPAEDPAERPAPDAPTTKLDVTPATAAGLWAGGTAEPPQDAPDVPDAPAEPDAPTDEVESPSEAPTEQVAAPRPGDEDVLGLRDADFPLALRGYNTHAVDRYVAQVEAAVVLFEENRSPTEAVRRALDRVGEQTAAILREAERSADETTSTAQAKADARLQRAEREAAGIWAAAQARAKSLDEDIERLWQERQRLIEATRELSGRLRAAADEAEAEFPPSDAPPPAN